MLKLELEENERELLALLVGSLAGGGLRNPLHLRTDHLEGRDEEIRQFADRLYNGITLGRET